MTLRSAESVREVGFQWREWVHSAPENWEGGPYIFARPFLHPHLLEVVAGPGEHIFAPLFCWTC